MIMMHRISGFRNRITGLKRAQTLSLPAIAISSSAMLLLAALAALLACGLVSPALATPLPAGTSADEGPVEDTNLTPVDCCAHTATLLRDIAVLQRSLSQVAESLAASDAKTEALARKLLESERTARKVQRENVALRSRLEAAPSLEEMPELTAASSKTRSNSSHTAQLSPDVGRNPYPATLPVFGAQPSGHWHGFFAELACTHGWRTHGA